MSFDDIITYGGSGVVFSISGVNINIDVFSSCCEQEEDSEQESGADSDVRGLTLLHQARAVTPEYQELDDNN